MGAIPSKPVKTNGHITRGRRRSNRRGGAVLETACVMPFLVLLTFGLIEYGHFFYLKHVLTGAAREGARAAIIASSDSDSVSATVETAMTAAGLTVGNYTVALEINGATATLETAEKGDLITVKIESEWEDIGLRPMRLISATSIVRGVAVMRKEGP
jgi:Flp pilus assembly protein TadG